MADGASQNKWWENNQTTKIDIAADVEVDKKNRPVRPAGSKRGCGFITAAVLLRLCGILGALGMLLVGVWILYNVRNQKGLDKIGQYGAMGAFLCIAGILALIGEFRTKRCSRGCMNTYIILASYLSRGILFVLVGGLMFTVINFAQLPVNIQISWIAGGLVAIGVLNFIYYIFYCQYKRKKAVALQPKYVANAEEIAYGMNLYDPEQRKLEEEKRKKAMEAATGLPENGDAELKDKHPATTTYPDSPPGDSAV